MFDFEMERLQRLTRPGIYAELLANRAFQGSNYNSTTIPEFNGSSIGVSENPIEPTAPVLTAWATVGDGVRMTLDRLHPLSSALPTAMQIDFPEDATGEVGFQNFGTQVSFGERQYVGLTCSRLVGHQRRATAVQCVLQCPRQLPAQSGQHHNFHGLTPLKRDR